MDLVTQALLGGTLAQSVMRSGERRLATATGLFAGMLADADIFIRSATDPLLTLEYHRHFTHSLLFIPIGAAVAASVVWLALRRRVAYTSIYLYALLGYSLSGFIDACTSYGTNLLWPFSDDRIAWSVIAIVDPVFSVILLSGLVMAYRRRSSMIARAALMLAGCYLLLGVIQHERATEAATRLAESRGHQAERLIVKPTIGNLLLWRSIYLFDDRFYVDAVRVASDTRVYEGERLRAFDVERDLPGLLDNAIQLDDVRRFSHFSLGFVTRHPYDPLTIGDIRYSMNPDGSIPLWGIRLSPGVHDEHVDYVSFRQQGAADRSRFLNMLLGFDIEH